MSHKPTALETLYVVATTLVVCGILSAATPSQAPKPPQAPPIKDMAQLTGGNKGYRLERVSLRPGGEATVWVWVEEWNPPDVMPVTTDKNTVWKVGNRHTTLGDFLKQIYKSRNPEYVEKVKITYHPNTYGMADKIELVRGNTLPVATPNPPPPALSPRHLLHGSIAAPVPTHVQLGGHYEHPTSPHLLSMPVQTQVGGWTPTMQNMGGYGVRGSGFHFPSMSIMGGGFGPSRGGMGSSMMNCGPMGCRR